MAYDVYLAVTRDFSGFRRWFLRSIVMLRVSVNFVRSRLRNMRNLFQQDGISTPRTWFRVCYFLLIYPGIYRRIFPAWLAFFRPGFHPWTLMTEALLKSMKPSYALSLPIARDSLSTRRASVRCR